MVSYAEYYGAVFPAEGDVATGEVYGPTGAEYTGTLSGGETAEEVAAAVFAYSVATTPTPMTFEEFLVGTDAKTTSIQSSVANIASDLVDLALKFTGITRLTYWLQRLFRSDAGTGGTATGMATALTEINAGGGSFAQASDSPEAIGTELAKVHKAGESRRYTQDAVDEGNKTADVTIGDPL